MKRKLINLVAATLLLVSCAKEATPYSESAEGSVQFLCEPQGLVSEITRATFELDLSEDLIPTSDQFSLTLTGEYTDYESGSEATYSAYYTYLATYHENVPLLATGDYKAIVSYGDTSVEGADNPCFYGEAEFEIVARKESSETIIANISNSVIRVVTTEWFDNYYIDAEFVVTTAAGNEFTFGANDGQFIFVAPGSSLTLSGVATKSQTGTQVTFPESTIGSTTVQTLSTITIDAGEAGGATLSITFDQTMTEVTLDEVELNPEA